MTDNEIRIQLLLCLQLALLGEVTPNLRLVACAWDAAKISIPAVFDGPISEDDRDRIEVAVTEIMASFPDHLVESDILRLDYPRPLRPLWLTRNVYKRFEPEPDQR